MTSDPLRRNNVTVLGPSTAQQTLVFVNGMGYDQRFWAALADYFAPNHRLVLFDHVGSIASNQPWFHQHPVRYLNVGGYATDLLEVLAALPRTPRTAFVGHSLGAMAALLACVQAPESADQLVLIGASPCYLNTDDYAGGLSKETINGIYSALQSDYPAWTQQLASMAIAVPDQPPLIARFAACLASIPPEMMLTVLCSLLQMDYRSTLAKVSTPTLIIQSNADLFVPLAVAEYLHAQIAQAQLALIPANGHLPHVSAPESVIAAICAFLQ